MRDPPEPIHPGLLLGRVMSTIVVRFEHIAVNNAPVVGLEQLKVSRVKKFLQLGFPANLLVPVVSTVNSRCLSLRLKECHMIQLLLKTSSHQDKYNNNNTNSRKAVTHVMNLITWTRFARVSASIFSDVSVSPALNSNVCEGSVLFGVTSAPKPKVALSGILQCTTHAQLDTDRRPHSGQPNPTTRRTHPRHRQRKRPAYTV